MLTSVMSWRPLALATLMVWCIQLGRSSRLSLARMDQAGRANELPALMWPISGFPAFSAEADVPGNLPICRVLTRGGGPV
jgi:hypothetical protein